MFSGIPRFSVSPLDLGRVGSLLWGLRAQDQLISQCCKGQGNLLT